MTQKELLYLEDAIGHEKNMISICEDIVCSLQDESLVSFMEKEIKKHKSLKEKLMEFLKEKAND